MQGYCDEHGLAFRPHIKTHKLPAIAHMQVRAGAVGITCQKLGEAEVMEAAGLRDILLTFPLVGAAKAERLAALAREATVVGRRRLRRPSRAGSPPRSRAQGAEVGFLVECDTGFRRTGVQSPEAAAELAELADSLPGPALRRADDLPDAAGDRAVAAGGARGDRGARACAVDARQRRRHADGRHRTTMCRRDHRGACRHVRLRRPLLHRERLGAARGLRAAHPRDRRQPPDAGPRRSSTAARRR